MSSFGTGGQSRTRWPSRSSSVTPTLPGNDPATRTSTASSGSGSPPRPTCASTTRTTSTPSPTSSTTSPDASSAGQPQPSVTLRRGALTTRARPELPAVLRTPLPQSAGRTPGRPRLRRRRPSGRGARLSAGSGLLGRLGLRDRRLGGRGLLAGSLRGRLGRCLRRLATRCSRLPASWLGRWPWPAAPARPRARRGATGASGGVVALAERRLAGAFAAGAGHRHLGTSGAGAARGPPAWPVPACASPSWAPRPRAPARRRSGAGLRRASCCATAPRAPRPPLGARAGAAPVGARPGTARSMPRRAGLKLTTTNSRCSPRATTSRALRGAGSAR